MEIDLSALCGLCGDTEQPQEGERVSGGMFRLQTQADRHQKDAERALEICQEYQRNKSLCSAHQTEILKGIKAGVSVYRLFLRACEAISLMTSDTAFYNQVERDSRAIYGAGLSDPLVLQVELDQVQTRLDQLRRSLAACRENDTAERIKRAITAHEAKAADLSRAV